MKKNLWYRIKACFPLNTLIVNIIGFFSYRFCASEQNDASDNGTQHLLLRELRQNKKSALRSQTLFNFLNVIHIVYIDEIMVLLS